MSRCFSGAQYFHGPSYLTAAEVATSQQQLFYKQEVFVSLAEDTHPVALVAGKCGVLDYNDYCARECAVRRSSSCCPNRCPLAVCFPCCR